VKAGGRLLMTWNPEPDAKQYLVQIATSDGFTRVIESRKVDGTTWAPNINLHNKRYRGILYWRVAPVDQRGGIGSFTVGTFGGTHAPRCYSGKGRARRVASCKKKRK
jgi:hypothetical protein